MANLLHPNEIPYLDQIRSKVLDKSPRLLFALSDSAIKTACIRTLNTQLVPDALLMDARPKFQQAVVSAFLHLPGLSGKAVLSQALGIEKPTDEQVKALLLENQDALALMFTYLGMRRDQFASLMSLPSDVWAIWPTMTVWLYMHHFTPTPVKNYLAMGTTLATFVCNFNQLPPDFETMWGELTFPGDNP